MDQPAPTTPEPTADYRLHRKLAAVWTMITAIVLSIPTISGIVLTLVFGLWFLAPLIVVLALVLIWLQLCYGRRYVATFRCTLSPLGLLIVRGVWWRSQSFMPRPRVQHTDVDQGPLARRFGMATLKVFTAGSEHSQIAVEGLLHEHAIELRNALIDRSRSKSEPESEPESGVAR